MLKFRCGSNLIKDYFFAEYCKPILKTIFLTFVFLFLIQSVSAQKNVSDREFEGLKRRGEIRPDRISGTFHHGRRNAAEKAGSMAPGFL
jgi:hypothetical protein